MPNHVHRIAVPGEADSLHRGIAEAHRRCTYRWSSASPHLAGRDDLLARVQPLLDLMPNWRDFLDHAPESAETKAIRSHARSGRPLGDDAFLDRSVVAAHWQARQFARRERPCLVRGNTERP
jgi:hypothetical protein